MDSLIYLDNAATTAVKPEVFEQMMPYFMDTYSNPASVYSFAGKAKKAVDDAREQIANALNAKTPAEVYFTGGGSEADNWAIKMTAEAYQNKGKHIITTAIEHAAVIQPMIYLQEQGLEGSYIPVDRYGRIDLQKFSDAIREDTILVSTMYVNNEIGTLEPIEEIGKIIKEKNPKALWHVDAIQAYGKYRIYPKKLGIDMLSVSGHKIHGPKGSGFLYIKDKTKIHPLLNGGGQQRGMRSGTENVPAIAGLGVAAERIYTGFEEKIDRMYTLREHFIEEVTKIPGVHVNGHTDRSNAPHIVSVSTEGVRAEVLLHALEDKEIYVSAGSACSSNKPSVSHTLKSIGLKPELLDATIRFSFCVETTEEEIDYAVKEMAALVPMLQKYTRH
mgnify:CR=1 FL=1